MTSAFSWQNSISLFPASFRIPRPNLPVTPGICWLPTFAFQSSIHVFTNPEGIPSVRIFIEVSLQKQCWLNHQPFVIKLTSSPSPLPQRPGVGPEVPTFNPLFGSFNNQPPLEAIQESPSHKYLLSIQNNTCHFKNSEGFRSCKPGNGSRNQIYILLHDIFFVLFF